LRESPTDEGAEADYAPVYDDHPQEKKRFGMFFVAFGIVGALCAVVVAVIAMAAPKHEPQQARGEMPPGRQIEPPASSGEELRQRPTPKPPIKENPPNERSPASAERDNPRQEPAKPETAPKENPPEEQPIPQQPKAEPEPPQIRAPRNEKEGPRYFTNSIGLKLVRIPAGELALADGKNLTVPRSLYFGRHEVRQREYQMVMGQNPSAFQDAENPVEQVTRAEAAQFCEKLSLLAKEKGRRYRLPSEIEWEYACRAGTRTAFSFGNSLDIRQANFNVLHRTGENVTHIGPVGKTTRVGSYPANAWGLYDMHGNVFEMVTAEDRDSHVLRGGSWYTGSQCCTSDFRHIGDPGFRDKTVGFRVVCETTSDNDQRGDDLAEQNQVRYLSDMAEFDVIVAEGRFAKKGDLGYRAGNSSRIKVKDKEWPNGISMHAPTNGYARAKYKLDRAVTRLRATAALNDTAGIIQTPLTFQVLGDGKVLWQSKPIQASGMVEECDVGIAGVKRLELRVLCPGPFINAQAVWLEPRVFSKR
jgi:formylglycine-generating enzyme required for sulfatase activity